ncbi:MAG TPA: hypothetical protein VLT47_05460 [Anaeromyxobacteraceae bacterium]|nr:hypothetical protein [Anaeromyxobacteraceae bacterium]
MDQEGDVLGRGLLVGEADGLLVDLRVEPATGHGERAGALVMLDEHVPDADGITLGADAAYNLLRIAKLMPA